MRRPRRDGLDEIRANDLEAARESALGLLERTRRTRADLRQRLREKGYADAAIGTVIDRLVEVGLVDDAEYARAWLAGRWGFGPLAAPPGTTEES